MPEELLPGRIVENLRVLHRRGQKPGDVCNLLAHHADQSVSAILKSIALLVRPRSMAPSAVYRL